MFQAQLLFPWKPGVHVGNVAAQLGYPIFGIWPWSALIPHLTNLEISAAGSHIELQLAIQISQSWCWPLNLKGRLVFKMKLVLSACDSSRQQSWLALVSHVRYPKQLLSFTQRRSNIIKLRHFNCFLRTWWVWFENSLRLYRFDWAYTHVVAIRGLQRCLSWTPGYFAVGFKLINRLTLSSGSQRPFYDRRRGLGA